MATFKSIYFVGEGKELNSKQWNSYTTARIVIKLDTLREERIENIRP